MATLSAWLSVLVKHGQDIIQPRTVVKCLWEDTFGQLLNKFDTTETNSGKVQIAASEKFTHPVHIVPIDAPVISSSACMCA